MTGIAQPDESATGLAFASAQAIVDRALERFLVPSVRMGTVDDWGFETGFVPVVLDGDTEPVLAANGTGQAIRPGVRVACLLYPPAGIIVQGILSQNDPPFFRTSSPLYVGTVPGVDATLSWGNTTVGDEDDIFYRVFSLLLVKVEGNYQINATVDFLNTAGVGHRRVDAFVQRLASNSSLVLDTRQAASGEPTYVQLAFELQLQATEGFCFIVRQNSASNFDARLTRFRMKRIGPYTG